MSVQCIRLLGFSFFGIEIAIGIGIDAVGGLILSNNVIYRKTIDIQFLVSKRHISSIPIAIPISIWIILTYAYYGIPQHTLRKLSYQRAVHSVNSDE